MAPVSPDWSLYRSFVAVLREGSLSGAARVLGVSQPTLGRHIAALESALELALFTRSPEGLKPTREAKALRPQAEALAAAAESLFRAASGPLGENEGPVRISASEVFAVEVLPPLLARLRETHPRIIVELQVSNRVEDLLRRDADLAVRVVRPEQDALLATRVGAVEAGLFAHPSYLARHPAPRTTAELLRHALVGFDEGAPYTRVLALEGRALTREDFSLRTDSDLAMLAAIRSGCGIGGCLAPLGLRSGLVRVLPRLFAPSAEVWVVMHEDLRATARCRTVFDALSVGLKDLLCGPARKPR
ncbi:LysR family transcriptional regulator [Myxococcus stipitatus DSM 14675]|uniref:LysR family transcriptional regulator n=1 Tax=Myxococcus stipitatus (strain DSM 14675 / JCM 12634 / Mx s8) TaxID=1278073 RepID=L7U6Q4_MYXSD|nr:LysR family transcriptional regulator [Myxococcus stipitatus]AGC43510.1 LysR family transcriptional regulator [Myxococcus stipitatus DSM 14675]